MRVEAILLNETKFANQIRPLLDVDQYSPFRISVFKSVLLLFSGCIFYPGFFFFWFKNLCLKAIVSTLLIKKKTKNI